MKTIAAWLMIVVSGIVMYVGFPGQNKPVFLPTLVGAWGIPFAVIFSASLLLVAISCKNLQIIGLMVLFFVIGAALGAMGRAVDLHGILADNNVSYTAYSLCAGSCVAGLGLGIAILRGWCVDEL